MGALFTGLLSNASTAAYQNVVLTVMVLLFIFIRDNVIGSIKVSLAYSLGSTPNLVIAYL